MNVLIIILIGIIFASLGQILWKFGMDQIGPISDISLYFIMTIFLQPFVILGLFCYAIGTIFWLIALSNADLSFVYPFIALTFVIIFLASSFIFRESISSIRLIGAIIIVIGILILVNG